ncbi:uncharacterized protein LOC134822183 [Bolinopsis microptera]|uniref:uncharacterized protein LOC134822183 n=1 Tax=Bolinopsis microptera TaxID=2820187 RepID=UPI0030793FD8
MTEGAGVSSSLPHPVEPCTPDMTEGAGVSSSLPHPVEPCTPDMTEGAGVSSSLPHPVEPCTPDMNEGAGVSSSLPHPSEPCTPDMTDGAGVSSSLPHPVEPCTPDMTEGAGVSSSSSVYAPSISYNEYRPYYDCHNGNYVESSTLLTPSTENDSYASTVNKKKETDSSKKYDTLSNMADKELQKEKDRYSARFMDNCPFSHLQSVSPNQHFTASSEPSACQSPDIESSSLHNFSVEDHLEVPPNASKASPVPLEHHSKSPPKLSFDPKTDNIVKTFRAKMREYPEYACIKCHKLFFREGVVKAKDTLKFKLNIPSVTKADNKWICKRCNSYLKRGKFSPIDVNEMFLASGDLPSSLQPNPTECRLVSQIIPFMKILSLPAGGQSCIKGPVVNVPIQPDRNCMQLPRKLSESGILAVRIKRKVEYKSVVMSDVVNPDKCITLLVWLKKNNPFYKNVVLSHDFIKQNYDGDKQFFDSYMNDDPVVVSMSILDLILSNVTNEGTYCDMPFESCIQKSDPAENIDDGKIPFMDFAPGQGSKPVPFLGNADYEALSFPDLFPLGKGHFNCSKRNDLIKKKLLPKLSLKDYAESKLYSKHRKYAQNPEYIFYMQNWIERDQLLSCIATHMRKGSRTMDGQIITAGLLRSYQCNMDQLQSNIDAYKFMKNMKGTPAYLQKIKNDGIAMVNQLGNFTWFLTFSFNDLVYSVPAILKLMGQEPTDELLSDISWFRKHELIKMDPVIAVRMFDRYVRKILSYLIEDQGVMGEALAHFGRNEFGGRGSPHLHMLLKVVGAPIPGESPIEEVIEFIDKYVTTHYPTLEEDPEVHKLIKLQLHSHTKTCQKGGKDICRFGFPKTLSEVTKIVFKEIKKMMTKKSKNNQKSADSEPKVEAPKLRSRDVIYKRKPGSENVNTYNRLLLLAIQGNMDVQICMSPWDVVNYVISYATKNEKEVCDALKDVIKNIDQPSNKNSKEALRQLGNTFLNSRSVSVQEAIFRCLPQLSLSHFKPSVLFIPSDMPGDRHGIVKPRSTLQQLPDDSEDVFHNSLLDKYLNRPDDLESICWAEFASLYVRLDRNVTSKNRHKVITLKSNLGQMIRRDSPQVIRSNKKSRTKEPEKYYYSKLCLYFPWRKEADLIGSFATYQESFAENVDAMKPNIKKFEQFDDDTLQKMEAEIRQEIKDSLLDENKREVLDGRHLFNHPFEGIDISKEEEKSVFNVTYKEPIVSDEQYQQMVTSLNDKQRELFNIVDHHSSRVAQGHKVNQLLHFVSGAGGVGKSFLIKCMRSCISRKFPDSIIKPRVAVAASTGVAAALIDGQTVHQLLQLDCQEGGRIQPKPLNPKKKMQMRRFFQHVRYIIIDEVSMVGNTNLNQINSRLNEIFGVPPETTIFGGINVIFSGDLHQIPAVQQTMVFETKGIAALGPNIWKDSITFSELTDIVRAKGDSQFTELCHRLRVGEHTPEDIELLSSRVVEKQPKPAEIMDSMVIYPTNRQCNSHNQECIQELSKTSSIVNVVAQDRFSNEVFNKSSNFGDKVYDKMNKKPQDYTTDDVNKTAGLPTSLNIGPGARVMVRVNIDTPDKVVNGVTGTVHSFQLQNGKSVKDGSCSARDIRHVNVMFDDVNVGRTIKHHCDNFCANNCTKAGTVPIKPVEKEFISKKNSYLIIFSALYDVSTVYYWSQTSFTKLSSSSSKSTSKKLDVQQDTEV